jgi:hypothetical protein
MGRSSAYEAMLGIGTGILEIKWLLKRAGKMTKPWGTLKWMALKGNCVLR